jgi:hypothetical protein
MLWHPPCAFFCLLSCLLVCFLLSYMYFRACPSFWNDLMLYLIVFCQQIVHIYIVCIYGGCCRCHFLDFTDFLPTHFPFCCFCSKLITLSLLSAFSFASTQLLFMIFWLVSSLFFLLCKSSGYTNLSELVFIFFDTVVWFFFISLAYEHYIALRTRWSAIISPLHPL